jgi:predicted regulator of Ras-like GTPase activity (Roadblock/LC7/MglB family)
MAFSQACPRSRGPGSRVVTSGLTSLTQGAARIFQGGVVTQVVVEMQHGVVDRDGDQRRIHTLAVLATADCDLGLVAYEMTLLAEKVRGALTPAAR